MAPILDTSKPEGRPPFIEVPAWWGSAMDPSEKLTANGQKADPNGVTKEKRAITLPPGIALDTFHRAMDDLRGLIGSENVHVNDGPLNDGDYYTPALSHDSYSVLDKDYFVPSAVVDPANTDEVVKIVKWANNWVIPLHTISIGRNLGYGGAAPRVPGSVVINMGKRMCKILDIDEDNATCLLEPGVTYIELYNELQRRKSNLWADIPDLGGGSVIGNAMDRGVGYTPHGDHWAQHCGMEIVLPTGEVVRTGMDAMEGSKTGQSFQYGFGPFHDGMFSQGNFGICTRMGFFLMPSPGGILPFLIHFPRREDLIAAVDIIRPMMLSRIFGNIPSLRVGMWDAAVYGSRESYWPECNGRPVPLDIEDKIVKDEKLGHWCFYGALYGPDEITKPTWEVVKRNFSKIEGVVFQLREDAPERSYLHDRARVFSGIPVFRELDWQQWVPNAGELFFAPVSPVSGKEAFEQMSMAKARLLEYGFDYLATYYIAPREMHHVITILFDRTNPDEKVRAEQCLRHLIDDAAKKGYGEYRSHIAFQDQIASTYNWNDGALMKLSETIKNALDPRGILQPGRSGIWPASYKNKGWELMPGVTPKVCKPEQGKL